MKRQNLKIESLCDGLKIDITIFEPDGPVEGIVQFSHGMIEHKEYYYEFMDYLCSNGYVCVINDHRGHGRSVNNESDYGYFYDETSDFVVEDLHQITLYVKSLYPNKDVYLFGHSMGSLIVRKYIKKYDNDISKLIVCGSPSINPSAKRGLKMAKFIKKTKGDRHRSKLLQRMAINGDKKHKWLSNDEEYLNKYNNDPMCGFTFTANGFINLTQLMLDVYSKEGWNLNNPTMPILFIAGEKDIVIKSKKKWNKSIKFLQDIGYTNIEEKIYPDMKHAIMFDKNKNIVFEDVLDFIKKQ